MSTRPGFPGPTSHSFISQRLRLHYVDWGNPEAPLLILQHGGRDHCRSWDWVAQALRDEWHIVCPDLRGHGESQWSPEGNYSGPAFVYDFAQLVEALGADQVTICAHSLGGNIATRFAGLYPHKVAKLANIEGLGLTPARDAEREATPLADRLRKWITTKRDAASRQPRRYPSIEAAFARMKSANPFLTEAQARHLTTHGINRNEDGTWSWKFDNYLNVWPPDEPPLAEVAALWRAVTCPVLLFYGANSFAINPEKDGRLGYFRNARVIEYEAAGHWLHHDQCARFVVDLSAFLSSN